MKNQLIKSTNDPLSEDGNLIIPAMMIPGFRCSMAIERGVEKNILIHAWGGLGDQICAEPSIRFACEKFKDVKISVLSEYPELFRHLPLENLFDLKEGNPENPKDFYVFYTVYPAHHINWEFYLHLHMHCVDYSAINMWRQCLPVEYKNVVLKPSQEDFYKVNGYDFSKSVAIHAGRHWQSKTFPSSFWEEIIKDLLSKGITPVLIGGDGADNSGTVDIDPSGCVDLRGDLSIMESVALLQKIPVLLTNDSAPLHMAASGNSHIGFVATCKHPDFITHWRNGKFGYRMKSFEKDKIYDHLNLCPNNKETTDVQNIGKDFLLSCLPDPKEMSQWAYERILHDS